MPRHFLLPALLLCAALSLRACPALAQGQPTGRTVKLNGIELYYEEHGAGEPLVLLHGFSGSGQAWKPYLDTFAAHYRVITVDMRGHGGSTNPSGEFTHRQSARDIFALLDTLGIERCMGIGSSSGGMTLLHMATQQPERVEAMILLGATSYFPEQAGRSCASATPTAWMRNLWSGCAAPTATAMRRFSRSAASSTTSRTATRT